MHVQAQPTIRVRHSFGYALYIILSPIELHCASSKHADPRRFVLKTKEQRAAEKALMDKSPLETLTLEDFLETERLKLTGTLTPVTPESFAKWKKERLDKKAAEEEARKAKEETGRAMFERGDWQASDSEEDEDEEDAVGRAEWDLERLRLETEGERAKDEEARLTGGDEQQLGQDDPSEDG